MFIYRYRPCRSTFKSYLCRVPLYTCKTAVCGGTGDCSTEHSALMTLAAKTPEKNIFFTMKMLDTLYWLSRVAYFSCYPYTMLILEVSPSKAFKSIISAPLLDETCDSINTNKTKISFNYIIKDKLSGHLKVKKKKRIIKTHVLQAYHLIKSCRWHINLETNSDKSFSCPHLYY